MWNNYMYTRTELPFPPVVLVCTSCEFSCYCSLVVVSGRSNWPVASPTRNVSYMVYIHRFLLLGKVNGQPDGELVATLFRNAYHPPYYWHIGFDVFLWHHFPPVAWCTDCISWCVMGSIYGVFRQYESIVSHRYPYRLQSIVSDRYSCSLGY